MAGNITVRVLDTMQDFSTTIDLQLEIWGMAEHECISPHTMKAVTINGGLVLGAEDAGQMIGFSFGVPAKRGDVVFLWSHITGVSKAYQGQGIGFMLKQRQRQWALEHGYMMIAWTFDPMQWRNANFNFNHLGTTAQVYYIEHYGKMQDSLNAGLASDRLEAVWRLNDERVIQLAEGISPRPHAPPQSQGVFLVSQDENTNPIRNLPDQLTDDSYCIEIPYDVNTLKQHDVAKAKSWQMLVREAMLYAIAQKYSVQDFITADERCWYVLRKKTI